MTNASGRLSRWLVPLIDSARNHTENQVLHGVRHRAEAGNPGLDQVDHAHFIDAQEEPAVVQLAERVKTDHDPDRPQDPGAHTYNDPAYAAIEGGAPVWMTKKLEHPREYRRSVPASRCGRIALLGPVGVRDGGAESDGGCHEDSHLGDAVHEKIPPLLKGPQGPIRDGGWPTSASSVQLDDRQNLSCLAS